MAATKIAINPPFKVLVQPQAAGQPILNCQDERFVQAWVAAIAVEAVGTLER